jgi:hypothetical protein
MKSLYRCVPAAALLTLLSSCALDDDALGLDEPLDEPLASRADEVVATHTYIDDFHAPSKWWKGGAQIDSGSKSGVADGRAYFRGTLKTYIGRDFNLNPHDDATRLCWVELDTKVIPLSMVGWYFFGDSVGNLRIKVTDPATGEVLVNYPFDLGLAGFGDAPIEKVVETTGWFATGARDLRVTLVAEASPESRRYTCFDVDDLKVKCVGWFW